MDKLRDRGELGGWERIIHEVCECVPSEVVRTRRECTYTDVAKAHRFKMSEAYGVGYKLPKQKT